MIFSPACAFLDKRDDTTIHRVYVGMDMDGAWGLHVDINRQRVGFTQCNGRGMDGPYRMVGGIRSCTITKGYQ